jgi:two-component system sensor histidine kinase HydH
MSRQRNDVLKCSLIILLILVTTILHYRTGTEHRYLHELYQRFYYIPILLAAYWYGPLPGVLAALSVSILYVYHIERDWTKLPVYAFNQYAEIVMYHVVAVVIGFLSLKDRRQREGLEKMSQELARAYDQLQETFDQLRRADRLAALGQLSAGIAHEIRNPLGSIKGSIEILESEVSPENPKYEFIRIIKEETTRLNSIVAEFLKFARPSKPSIEPTSLNDLIESTLVLFAKQEGPSKVEIRKHLASRLPLISVDPDQIRQVLLNIILNGVQAMPEGGILDVTTRLEDEQDRVSVEISDTGTGIEEESLDRVFDPFFTTKPQGTGLGLAISHQLIKNHAGGINVRKNPDRGVTFQIELPISQSKLAQGA